MNKHEWEKKASGLILGKKIIHVSYISEQDNDMLIPTIELEGGILLYVQNDDEGNSSGTIHTNIQDNMVILPQMVKDKYE